MKYVVFDLEICGVPKSVKLAKAVKLKREIIQIGAATLNENFILESTFVTYVKPRYGYFDKSVEKLTRIKNSDLAKAPNIENALLTLEKWLPQDDINFVTWSNSDMQQLKFEFSHKSIQMPILQNHFDTYFDCQEIFSRKLGTTKRYSLSEALNISNVFYEDESFHNAKVDAINTALLFAKIQKEDTLKMSPYYIH